MAGMKEFQMVKPNIFPLNPYVFVKTDTALEYRVFSSLLNAVVS